MAPALGSIDSVEIEDTWKLLNEGVENMDLSEKYRNVTLALGITGSGKSTFVQWLAGDDSKLISVKLPDSSYIIKDGKRISESTIESKTIIPELVIKNGTNNAFYDCPGFSDTRSAKNDIATTYFIKKVIDHAQSLKMLFVINHGAVQSGVDRREFMQLVRHATEMIKDVDKYKGSIALVATKVKNDIIFADDGITPIVVSDESIISGIAYFLSEVRRGLVNMPPGKYESAIKFVDILLQQNGKGYPKIQIFRRPNKAGPLNEIPLYQKSKKDMSEMVSKLEFTPVERNDFGFTISDGSKNMVNGLVERINDSVWQDLEKIVLQINQFYGQFTKTVGDKVDLLVSSDEFVTANLVEARTFANQLFTGYQTIVDLMQDMNEFTSIEELTERLDGILAALDISTGHDNLESLKKQASYFAFLKSFGNSPLPINKWQSQFQGVLNALTISKHTIQTNVEKAVRSVASKINTTVTEVASDFWNTKLSQMSQIEIQQLPAKLDQDYAMMLKMTEDITKLSSAEQLAATISKYAVSLDVESALSKRKTLDIFNQAKYLNYLQILSEHKLINIWSLDWIAPFNQTLKSIVESLKWYRFLNDLHVKLGEYRFQQNTKLYNVANLDNWGKGQETDSFGIHLSEENQEQFISILSQYNVAEYAAVKQLKVTDWQREELNQLLRITLKQQVDIQCPKNGVGSVVISGDYVKFSDILLATNRFPDLCKNGTSSYSSVNIFASNTVFLDTDLDAVGDKMKLTVAAPRWETSGHHRSVLLSGSQGKELEIKKAPDGKHYGNDGEPGKPGLPGGSAGSFLGIGQDFVIEGYLYAYINGGVGGPAQAGGDGHRGMDGKDAEKPSKTCVITGKSEKLEIVHTDPIFGKLTGHTDKIRIFGEDGTPGGNGASGGEGGINGHQGNADIFNLKGNNTDVIKIRNDNYYLNGTPGRGGWGGRHGKRGNNRIVYCTWDFLFPNTYYDDLDQIEQDRSYGRGYDGSNFNSEGIKKPEPASIIRHPANRINEYKRFLRGKLNDLNWRFNRNATVHFLEELNNDEQVRQSYDVLALAGELKSIEDQSASVKNKNDLIQFYEAMLEQIRSYVEVSRPTKISDQEKKMLNYLYTATLSKLYNLKSGDETNLVIDVESYLQVVQQNVRSLKELRQRKNEHEIIEGQKNAYESAINEQIKEAKQFIEGEVTPAIEKINSDIDKQVKKLVDEIVELQKEAKENVDKLVEVHDKLQAQLPLRALFSGLKVAGHMATFAGPYGMAIGTAVGGGSQIAEAFLLDDQTASGKPLTLPAAIKDNMKLIETEWKAMNEKKAKNLKDQLDAVKKIVEKQKKEEASNASGGNENQPSSTLQRISDSCSSFMGKLANIFGREAPEAEVIREVEDLDGKVKSLFDKMEKEIETNKAEERTKRDVQIVKTVNQIVQLGGLGLEIYSKISGDIGKMNENDAALNQTVAELKKIDQYEKDIYAKMTPSLQKMQHDIRNVQEALGTKSQVGLDVAKWQVQGNLRDVMVVVRTMTKDMQMSADLLRCIEKLEEAITTIIQIYDRIQNYQQQQNLANFIANIHSSEVNSINISDPKLAAAVNSLEIAIRSNVALQQYQSTIVALKQLVFPYAHLYLRDAASLDKLQVSSDGSVDDLVTRAISTIEKVKAELLKNRTTIGKYDKYAHRAIFDNTQDCASGPFYVWGKEKHSSAIASLLAGEPILLKADVRRSDFDKDAIKFNLVELNLLAQDYATQAELDQHLKQFHLLATHLGNSYYRYGSKYYLISSDSQRIQYSFARKDNNEPRDYNQVYKKIKDGDLMLSPYAMWQFQLVKANQTASFAQLEMYKNSIDLQLIGEGSYTESRAAAGEDDLQVERYYQQDDDTKAQLDYQDLGQQYQIAQLNYMQMHQIPRCSAPQQQATSIRAKLARAYAKAKANIFGSSSNKAQPINTNTDTPLIGDVPPKNNNLIRAPTNSIDVHGNLLLGQLLVGSLVGKNDSLASITYMSPEMRRSVQVERLARKVLPALKRSQPDGQYNRNNQWHKDMFPKNATNSLF